MSYAPNSYADSSTKFNDFLKDTLGWPTEDSEHGLSGHSMVLTFLATILSVLALILFTSLIVPGGSVHFKIISALLFNKPKLVFRILLVVAHNYWYRLPVYLLQEFATDQLNIKTLDLRTCQQFVEAFDKQAAKDKDRKSTILRQQELANHRRQFGGLVGIQLYSPVQFAKH